MRWDWRALVCLLLAFAVAAIFVSPLVPSPPTTIRTQAPVAVMTVFSLAAFVLLPTGLAALQLQAELLHPDGRFIVALTTARLC